MTCLPATSTKTHPYEAAWTLTLAGGSDTQPLAVQNTVKAERLMVGARQDISAYALCAFDWPCCWCGVCLTHGMDFHVRSESVEKTSWGRDVKAASHSNRRSA